MAELLIMRHAKSEWGVGLSSDRERPLAKRGVKAAKRMGRALTRMEMEPSLVLASPAVRARATAETAMEAGGWTGALTIVDPFYGGGWGEVVDGVREHGHGHDRVLVVGHEPTWSALVSVLTGGGSIAMPTAALSCVSVFGADWASLGPGCGELLWHLNPRMVKAIG